MQERLISEADENAILDKYKKYRISPWAVQSKADHRVIGKTDGCFLWDASGNSYYDLWSQFCFVNVGHQHPRVVEAIKNQADTICALNPGMANEAAGRLAETLVQVAPEAMTKVFFTLGGAEANEHAIRMAQVFTGKHKILSRYRSYHGATLGAISASGDPRRFGAEPIPAGFVHVPDCYCYRCPFEKSNPECDLFCARHIETVIELEGDIAAVLIEPIVGANGLLIPPPGYIRMVKEICDRHGVLLIADEIMTGFGRTGRWFACNHDNVVPDLMTLAKGLTSGYVPLGAVILASHVADFFQDRFLPSGLTYSSHPLSCAAGVAVLEVMKDEKLVENSERLGRFLHAEIEALKDRHPCVGDVRSLGLFGCIELVADRETKAPLVPWNSTGSAARPTQKMAKYLMSKGIMPRIRWSYFNIGPPLITTEDELKWVLHTVDEALSITDEYAGKQ